MSLIKIWKCDHHKNCYFEKKIDYVDHLKEMAVARMRSKRYCNAINDLQRIIDGVNFQENVQDILDYVIENDQAFVLYSIQHNSPDVFKSIVNAFDNKWRVILPRILSIKVNCTYYDNISNTHSCPRNGIRNWSRDKDKPTGYPGWQGRISAYFNDCRIIIDAPASKKGQRHYEYTVYIGSSIIENAMGFSTGTGGGGTHSSFDIKIFKDDWPSFKHEITMAKLAADNPNGTGYLAAIGSGFSELNEIVDTLPPPPKRARIK